MSLRQRVRPPSLVLPLVSGGEAHRPDRLTHEVQQAELENPFESETESTERRSKSTTSKRDNREADAAKLTRPSKPDLTTQPATPSPKQPKLFKTLLKGFSDPILMNRLLHERDCAMLAARYERAQIAVVLSAPELNKMIKVPRPGSKKPLWVSYADVGPADGRPVVVFLSSTCIRHLVSLYKDYADRYNLRLLCFDRWGVGRTGIGKPSERGLAQWARIVENMLDKLHIRHFQILAHSVGALYALTVADHLSDRVIGKVQLLAPWMGRPIEYGPLWLDGLSQLPQWKLERVLYVVLREGPSFVAQLPAPVLRAMTPGAPPKKPFWKIAAAKLNLGGGLKFGFNRQGKGDAAAVAAKKGSGYAALLGPRDEWEQHLDNANSWDDHAAALGTRTRGGARSSGEATSVTSHSSKSSQTTAAHAPPQISKTPFNHQYDLITSPLHYLIATAAAEQATVPTKPLEPATNPRPAQLYRAMLRRARVQQSYTPALELRKLVCQRTTQAPPFVLRDLHAPLCIWWGDADSQVSLAAVRYLEREVRAQVKVLPGKHHGLVVDLDVMRDVFAQMGRQIT